MEDAAYNILLFALGVGLAFLLYYLWKHVVANKDCGCSKVAA